MFYQMLLLLVLISLQKTICEVLPFLYLNASINENVLKDNVFLDNIENDNNRIKRQSVYYICGVYPNQYYSTVRKFK